jgi:FADH2 O2-dependent halogenase
MTDDYDVIVIGSGLAGSILGLLLQRTGIRTLVVERKSHPRFAIGESTVPTTSAMLGFLASRYDVPELAQLGHYLGLRANGCRAWPKQGFWYGVHEPGRALDPKHELMLESLLLPTGPDVHMLRADADAFLVSRFGHYGVAYRDNTEITDLASDTSGVQLRLQSARGSSQVRARFVVDASGHASYLANRFALRDDVPRFRTNTRSLFAHFRGPHALEAQLGPGAVFRFRRDACTMHHCFAGGWLWVIPFDDGTVSVGLQLDRDMYPLDASVPPEVEFRSVCERYPTIDQHLAGLELAMPIVRTGRVQFTSRTILGDGFILAPHAAAFVEPLFSTGLTLTLAFCSRFIPAALAAQAERNWAKQRFSPLETTFFQEVHQIDRLVHGCFRTFHDYELFKQYWRAWVIATVAQYTAVSLARGAPAQATLYGSGLPGFPQALETIHGQVSSPTKPQPHLAYELNAALQPWWERVCEPTFTTQGDWSVGSDRACCVSGRSSLATVEKWLSKLLLQYAQLGPELSMANARRNFSEFSQKLASQRAAYHESVRLDTDYHRAYDRILANATDFDYRAALGLGRAAGP